MYYIHVLLLYKSTVTTSTSRKATERGIAIVTTSWGYIQLYNFTYFLGQSNVVKSDKEHKSGRLLDECFL